MSVLRGYDGAQRPARAFEPAGAFVRCQGNHRNLNSSVKILPALAYNPRMAKCDTGYFCRICESYVEDITDSELYLRYVLGEVPFEQLVDAPEAHIRCVPELAQYIVDRAFGEPVVIEDPQLDKRHQDRTWVAQRELRVSNAWRRLQMLLGSGLDIYDYPLPPESAELIEPAS